MQNPILRMLSASQSQNQNSFIDKINLARSIVSGKDPEQVFKNLMAVNPQFQKFIRENDGKTIEDIAMEYDIDLDMIRKFM